MKNRAKNEEKQILFWHFISTNITTHNKNFSWLLVRFANSQPSTWILKFAKILTLRLPTISRNFMIPFKLSSELVDAIAEWCLIENWRELAVWSVDIRFNTLVNLKTFSILWTKMIFFETKKNTLVSRSVKKQIYARWIRECQNIRTGAYVCVSKFFISPSTFEENIQKKLCAVGCTGKK